MVDGISSFVDTSWYEYRETEQENGCAQGLHRFIFIQTNLYDRTFSMGKNFSPTYNCSSVEKAKTLAFNSPVGASVGGQLGVDCEWGGRKGSPLKISASASGYVSDDKGSRINGSLRVNEDGSGRGSLSASHEGDFSLNKHQPDKEKKNRK